MRLAALLACLPFAAEAGADPEALYRTLVSGAWAEEGQACTDETTWTFYEGGLNIHSDGGETCGFDRPIAHGGIDVVLDVFCPIPGEEMQASACRTGLDLESIDPGLPDPGDVLTVADRDQTLTLRRCPAAG